ncbi:two-component system chemotaxis response regulator CheB [Desulfofundulus luciae]|uniref:Protein-glutamate methylesterase/protein-glutamine glutaminase n=1 Tax=Desulfofundulus luciae TaxID=74702 RepID=A0ABU0AYS5_9FIRM|nr:chemotaxis-specific protein-glutamate methyltransferase CheB [Desulfofundulus luciae]MDQ0285635.1 two-component system chemotaxis response regulator CheB [Desulfofundulus luciae]
MAAIRVLVVDDSALMRRLITRLLESRGYNVIDTAADGEEAVAKICALKPDVVSLDLDMPVLDGLGVLRRVMKECPVPVVMLSSHTTAGARATMRALSLGAVDFVAKPSGPGRLDAMVDELVEKLRAAATVAASKLLRPGVGMAFHPFPAGKAGPSLPSPRGKRPEDARTPPGQPGKPAGVSGRKEVPPVIPAGTGSVPERYAGTPRSSTPPARDKILSLHPAGRSPSGAPAGTAGRAADAGSAKADRDTTAGGAVPRLVLVPKRSARIDLVVIGSSTGGPAALQVIIPALPEDFPAAVVLVQHLPVGFSGSLAEHLNRRSRLPVKHAEEGDPVVPGRVLVAPAGFDLTFRGQPGHVTVHLDAGSGPVPPGGFRPSVDGVMLSAAEVFGARVMGVLLTGMGRDGARGMAAIREKGGPTIVQDESTCVVFGMPKAAIEMGAAQKVVPLGEVAGEIARLV